jgi:hypothetical protein
VAAGVDVVRLARNRERDGAGEKRSTRPVPDQRWLAVAPDAEELLESRPDTGHMETLAGAEGILGRRDEVRDEGERFEEHGVLACLASPAGRRPKSAAAVLAELAHRRGLEASEAVIRWTS